MGRPPKGDRAMTATERHQRHMAKKLAAAAVVAAPPPAPVPKPDMSDLYLKFIHLRMVRPGPPSTSTSGSAVTLRSRFTVPSVR